LPAAIFGAANVLATGTATATGTAETNSVVFGRVGNNAKDVPNWGKVTIEKVTVMDLVGREKKEVTWSVVGGAGTSRPTIKFSPKLAKGDYVRMELTTANAKPDTKDGDWGYVCIHLY